MAQIIPVVSEALQTTIRRLLPSQSGFGEDLQAQNVIVPIIDLTASAEGSGLPVDLSRSLAFGSQTVFDVTNTTAVIANTAGFYRIFGTFTAENSSSVSKDINFEMTDGFTTKVIYGMKVPPDSSALAFFMNYDFNVYLGTGITLSANVTGSENTIRGSVRQIATTTGELVNPAGYTA